MELTKEIEEEIKELEYFLGLAFLDFEDYNITYKFEIKLYGFEINENKHIEDNGSSFRFRLYDYYYNKYYLNIVLYNKVGLDIETIKDTFNNCIEKFNILSDIKIDFSNNRLYEYDNNRIANRAVIDLKSNIRHRMYLSEKEYEVLKKINKVIPLKDAYLQKLIGKLTPKTKRISINRQKARSYHKIYPDYISFIRIAFYKISPKNKLEEICLDLRNNGINIQLIEYDTFRKRITYSLIL